MRRLRSKRTERFGDSAGAQVVGAFDVVIVNGPNAAVFVSVASVMRTRTECGPSASVAVSSVIVPLVAGLHGTTATKGFEHPAPCWTTGTPSTSMIA